MFALFNSNAQTLSQYFVRDIPLRHQLNPAFQSEKKYYISLPVLGYTQISYHNTSFSLQETFEKDIHSFYNSLLPENNIYADIQTNLLSAGMGIHNTYLSLNIAQKGKVSVGLPKDLYKFIFFGTPDKYDNLFNLNSLGFSGISYLETSIGISQQFNEQWTIGMKLKLLSGNANMSFVADNLNISGGVDSWNLNGQAQFSYAGAADMQTNKISELSHVKYPNSVTEWLKPHGYGAGIDFGVHFRMLQNLYLSFSVTDLGFIHWKGNVVSNKMNIDYKFNGFVNLNSTMSVDELNSTFSKFKSVNNTVDSLLNDIKTNVQSETYSAYNSNTNASISLGAEYRFLSDQLSLGLLYNTTFYNTNSANRLMTSINYKPFHWINTTLSHTYLNGYNSIGAGVNLNFGIVSFFSFFDIIPNGFANLNAANSSIPFPFQQNSFNFAAGLSMAFGKRVKLSEYISTSPYSPNTGLYRHKFKKSRFLWDL